MKRYHDVMARCPYYNGEEKQKIFCEGLQEGNAIHLAFDTPDNRRDFKKARCNQDYNKCPIAQMLNRKWGYDA